MGQSSFPRFKMQTNHAFSLQLVALDEATQRKAKTLHLLARAANLKTSR